MNADPPFFKNYPSAVATGMCVTLPCDLSNCKSFFAQNHFLISLFISILSDSPEMTETTAVEFYG